MHELRYGQSVLWLRSSTHFALLGLAAGLLYAALDYSLDMMLGVGSHEGSLATFHLIVLVVLPCATGMALGLILHSRREKSRAADMLRLRLERIERQQTAWMMAASVLHEVNNPLHAIGLLVDEALQEQSSPLLLRVREHIDRIGKHLLRLRELPRTGNPEPEVVRLDEIVRFVLASRQSQLDELDVSTRTTVEVQEAWANEDYVRLVVENLVDNALRALRAVGAERTLEIHTVRSHEEVRIEVRDNGPGVSGDPQLAFEVFRSDFEGGLGLGLPIARALARTMQGELELEGGAPTTFVLRLPQVAR